MKIVSDHGFPKSDGSLPADDAFERFKNERDYNDDSAKRARVAYDTFRNGCPFGGFADAPEWEKAPAWVRDVVLVAYLQGTLDGPRALVGGKQGD